jgi:hypothetical protein
MNERNPFILRKERSYGQKIESSFEFIRLTVKPLFKSLLFYTSPFVLVGMFMLGYVLSFIIAVAENTNVGVAPQEDEFVMVGLAVMGFMFLMVFAGSMVLAVVFSVIRLYEEKEHANFDHKDVWGKIKKLYWPLVGTLFVYSMIFGVTYTILMLVLSLVLSFAPLLVLPVVYLIISFFMVFMFTAISIQFFDSVSLGRAFSRTFKVLKDNWWASVGLFITLLIIYNAMVPLFSLPFYANMIIGMNTAEIDLMSDPPMYFQLLNYLFAAILLLGSFFSYSVSIVGMSLQYFSLSEARDAKALLRRIRNMGQVEEEEEGDY